MERFTFLKAIAAPMPQPNIDTDAIIRIERLRDLPRDQLGPYAFEMKRYRPDGTEVPDFVLNQEPYRRAQIILGGRNFACGSSREAAVWALWGFGVRCVVAPSFGPIFFTNCFQNGMLPVVLPAAQLEALARQAGSGAPVTVDLAAQHVVPPVGEPMPFRTAPLRREALLEGLDELGQTRKREPEIAAWQARDRAARPWIWRDEA